MCASLVALPYLYRCLPSTHSNTPSPHPHAARLERDAQHALTRSPAITAQKTVNKYSGRQLIETLSI